MTISKINVDGQLYDIADGSLLAKEETVAAALVDLNGRTEVLETNVQSLQDSSVPYYGIRWTSENTTPVRIGNMELHRTLPIQSLMRRCMVTDSGEVRYIDSDNPRYYINGDAVDYTGAHGQFMVEIPEYAFECGPVSESNGVTTYELKLYINDTLTSKKSRKVYIGAVEASSDDASSPTTPKLYSIVTTNIPDSGTISADSLTYTSNATTYRGGDQNSALTATVSTWDAGANSQLGRPVTNYRMEDFRERAAARGMGWSLQYWDAYMAMVRLYVVEYCNFNNQADYNGNLTSEGYHQGGLGHGVSGMDSPHWNNFNIYNPVVPCGVTIRLGSNTGVVPYTVTATSSYTFNVPSYRGVENPFGHIWEWLDGMNVLINIPSGKCSIYTCSDITKFANDTTTNYILRTQSAPYQDGYIKECNIDELGDFITTGVDGSSQSYYYGYFTHGYSDGFASVTCGGCCDNRNKSYLIGIKAYRKKSSGTGSRLCYTPTT